MQETSDVVPQNPPVENEFKTLPGGLCEGCEIMFIGSPVVINAVDTSKGWFEPGEKLHLEGTVFKKDQKTPAANVILYYYHTDHAGHYLSNEGMLPSSRRHGYLRGWVKTGPDGRYSIYTSKPAPYPNQEIEAHIHVYIKEPYLDIPYYIDELVFKDDPLLTSARKNRLEKRGGSGILQTHKQNDVLEAKHDIILGLNIPGYPN